MDPTIIIATVAQVIKLAVDIGPTVIKGVEDAKPFAESIVTNLVGRSDVSDADLQTLADECAALSAQLQAPLPPE